MTHLSIQNCILFFNDTILSYKCVKDREVPLAQWIRRVPTEHEIPGSSPGWYISTQVIKIKIKKRKEKRKITFKGITSGSAEVQKSLKTLKKAINRVLGGTFLIFR